MMTVAVQTRIDFSTHALERYRKRVGTALDLDIVRARLLALAGCSELTPDPPGWLAAGAREESVLYLLIGSDVAFPLVYGRDRRTWIAKTCLARGGLSDAARHRRNTANATRRARRRRGQRGPDRNTIRDVRGRGRAATRAPPPLAVQSRSPRPRRDRRPGLAHRPPPRDLHPTRRRREGTRGQTARQRSPARLPARPSPDHRDR